MFEAIPAAHVLDYIPIHGVPIWTSPPLFYLGVAKDVGKMAGELKDVPKEFQVLNGFFAVPYVWHQVLNRARYIVYMVHSLLISSYFQT